MRLSNFIELSLKHDDEEIDNRYEEDIDIDCYESTATDEEFTEKNIYLPNSYLESIVKRPITYYRGLNYYHNNQVQNIICLNGDEFSADVIGTHIYRTEVQIENNMVVQYSCNCKNARRKRFGPCKHVVALLCAINHKSYAVAREETEMNPANGIEYNPGLEATIHKRQSK